MAGMTLHEAEEQLQDWLKASRAASRSQSYTIEGYSYTRADTGKIKEMIQYWQEKVIALKRGAGIRIFRGVSR